MMMGASLLRADSRQALIPEDDTQFTAGMAYPVWVIYIVIVDVVVVVGIVGVVVVVVVVVVGIFVVVVGSRREKE